MELVQSFHHQLGPELVYRHPSYVHPAALVDTIAYLIAVFILPFFMMSSLKLRKRQKIALCGVFSLGMITIIISASRFIVYTVTDYGVDDATGSK